MILPTISFEESMKSGGQITTHKRHSRNELYSVHVRMPNSDTFIYTNISPQRLKPFSTAEPKSPIGQQKHPQPAIPTLPNGTEKDFVSGDISPKSSSSSTESSNQPSSFSSDTESRPTSSLSGNFALWNAISDHSTDSFEGSMKKGGKVVDSEKYIIARVWVIFPTDGAIHQFSGISRERLDALSDAAVIDHTFQAPRTTILDDLRKGYSLEECVLHGAKIVEINPHEFYSARIERPDGVVDTFSRIPSKQYKSYVKEVDDSATLSSTRSSSLANSTHKNGAVSLFTTPKPVYQGLSTVSSPSRSSARSSPPRVVNRTVRSVAVPTGVVDFGLDSVHNSKLAGDIDALREQAAMREVVSLRENLIREQQSVGYTPPRQHVFPNLNTDGQMVQPAFSYYLSPPHAYLGQSASKSFGPSTVGTCENTSNLGHEKWSAASYMCTPFELPSYNICNTKANNDNDAGRQLCKPNRFISDHGRSDSSPRYQKLAPPGLMNILVSPHRDRTMSKTCQQFLGSAIGLTSDAIPNEESPVQAKEE